MGDRCRLCAEGREDLVALLEEPDLSAKIHHFFQIQITAEDRLPTSICVPCRDSVNQIWEFSERVQKAQLLFDIVSVSETKFVVPLANSTDMVECVFSSMKSEEPEQTQPKRLPVRKKSARSKVTSTIEFVVS